MSDILKGMEKDQYIQFSVIQTHKIGPFKIFKEGHATLIFKTIGDYKEVYNFYGPNEGFKSYHNIDDLTRDFKWSH